MSKENNAAIIPPSVKEQELSGKFKSNSVTLTTWKDLSNGDVSKDDIFNMYDREFGKRPDAVYLNEDICNEYNHHCYNSHGEATYSDQKINVSQTVANSRTLVNDLEKEVTYTVTLSASKSKSASVTVTEMAGFSFGETISVGSEQLGLGTEFSTNFTFENSVGSTSSTNETVTITDNVEITLSPGQKAVVDLDLEWKVLRQNFEIPFNISGWTGANYGHKVNGHHYWFLSLGHLQDGFPRVSYLRGVVETAYDIKGKIHTRPATV